MNQVQDCTDGVIVTLASTLLSTALVLWVQIPHGITLCAQQIVVLSLDVESVSSMLGNPQLFKNIPSVENIFKKYEERMNSKKIDRCTALLH